MERSIADELYSDISNRPAAQMDPVINSIDNNDDLWYDDDASNDGGVEKLENASDMDREWQKRHDQFHTIGYRDGLMSGKEASAQEGFNIGFKESFFVGRRWGLVRGVTSALACIPNELKIKLVKKEDKLKEIEDLNKTIHSLSTNDVLKSFYDNSLKDNRIEQGEEVIESGFDSDNPNSDKNIIESHIAKFNSLASGSSFAGMLSGQ